ncbi:MAG: halocyanin-like protein [Halovenus sp.]|jgi:halocyanin-like protein
MDRRRFITLVGGTGATGLAGCLGGDGGDPPAEPEPGDWFGPTDNYDGFEDVTARDTVTVAVGAGEEGLLFDPPAVTVDPGTALRFEWTGEGGLHNVQDPEGNWENPEGLVSAEGHTWERSFDSAGTQRYRCRPHSNLGMRGAVFVDATE